MKTTTRWKLGMGLSWAVVAAFAACDSGSSGLGDVSSAATAAYPGPQFPGAGKSAAGAALALGNAVVSCNGPVQPPAGSFGPGPTSLGHETCFYSADDPSTPAATMEWIVESAPIGDLVHVRLTLNPAFVDNTYGSNAIGWTNKMPAGPMGMKMPAGMMPMPAMAAHTFKDLVESDHAEFKLSDAKGSLAMSFDADYISADSSAPSGYATLGVLGGEGKMLSGNATDVVAVSTSLDRDLNACGLGSYLTDSPATDANYTPNAVAPDWDYRVVYDVWVKRNAFGTAGFGAASVDFVHASPSKQGGATLIVTPGSCPPAWPPYCADPAGCCVEIDSPSCSPAYVPPVKTCTENCVIGI